MSENIQEKIKLLRKFGPMLEPFGINLDPILASIKKKDFDSGKAMIIEMVRALLNDILKLKGIDKKIEKINQFYLVLKEEKSIDLTLPTSLDLIREIEDEKKHLTQLEFDDPTKLLNELLGFINWYVETVNGTHEIGMPSQGEDNGTRFLIKIGDKLGKYVVKEFCEKGGDGKVYKVWHELENDYKAMKTVPDIVVNDDEALKRLRAEINIAKKITHHNVVKFLVLDEDKGVYFLIMEYIDGENLLKKLKSTDNDRLGEYEVINYMIQVAEGLIAIHKEDVIHGDLKPNNIMVNKDGVVKILDFSISKTLSQPLSDYIKGAWPYMAPELFSEGKISVDKQTDIWSLGATMYYLLSDKRPFEKKEDISDPTKKPSPLSYVLKETNDFIMKCLEKDKKSRFENMEQVLEQLKNISQLLPAPSSPIEIEESQDPNKASNTTYLTQEIVQKILKDRGFFDSIFNKEGDFKGTLELKLLSSHQVVIDATTKLMWHPSGSPGYMNMGSAKEWLTKLNSSGFAGYSDWRLPTLEEAASLLRDKINPDSLYIDPLFSKVQTRIYTSDIENNLSQYMWLVDFELGNAFLSSLDYGFVRPVRSV